MADNVELLYLLANADVKVKRADQYEEEIKYVESWSDELRKMNNDNDKNITQIVYLYAFIDLT